MVMKARRSPVRTRAEFSSDITARGSGSTSMAAGVAYQYGEAPVGQHLEIVVVTADFVGGAVGVGEPVSGDFGRALREQISL